MKPKIQLLFVLFVMPIFMMGQVTGISDLFDSYKGSEGVTIINIDPSAVDINPGGDEDMAQLKQMADQVNMVRIMKVEGEVSKEAKTFYKKAQKIIEKGNYKPMISVMEQDEEVNIYMISGEDVNEFIILVKEADEMVVMSVVGTLDLAKMMNVMQEFKGHHSHHECDENHDHDHD